MVQGEAIRSAHRAKLATCRDGANRGRWGKGLAAGPGCGTSGSEPPGSSSIKTPLSSGVQETAQRMLSFLVGEDLVKRRFAPRVLGGLGRPCGMDRCGGLWAWMIPGSGQL